MDDLLAQAEARPQLEALKALIAKQEKAVDLAKKDYFPDATVSVGYGFRETLGPPVESKTGGHVHRLGDVQPAHLAGLQDQAQDPGGRWNARPRPKTPINPWDQLAAAIKDRHAKLQRLAKQITLYDQGIIPQARQAAEASLASYSGGHPGFHRLYQNQIAAYNAEMPLQEYLKDFEENWAELEWLVGAELPRPAGGKQMTPASRGKAWWGLGLFLVLAILAGLYFSGVVPLPFGQPKPQGPLLCLAQEPQFHQGGPGQGPGGQRTGAGLCHPGPRPAARHGPRGGPRRQAGRQDQVLALPHASGNRPEAPGNCPKCGMDLVPVQPEGAPAAAPPAPAAKRKERKIKYWVSPMDPGYVRDKPGKAPCGMDLVPVYEEAGGEAAAPGAIAVSPTTIQSMGVRTAKVEVRPLSRLTLAVGLVTFNERNLAVITTKVNGWVERLYVNATGDPVRKGQTSSAFTARTW